MKDSLNNRRTFLRGLGLGTAGIPFFSGLQSLRGGDSPESPHPPKRLVIMFSPNGTLPDAFWPDQLGDHLPLKLPSILKPLEDYKDQMLILKGVHNKIRGDGDNHMRGMSCLLTATELLPGNIQGGSDSPAGWAGGISIDQEIGNFFQSKAQTRTRFGSLEFGVAVPNRADPWTRMCYADSNKPIAPIDDPDQMFHKLYGGVQDRRHVGSILDHLRDDIRKVSKHLSGKDHAVLQEHMALVRRLEKDIQAAASQSALHHPEPAIDPDIELVNDNTPAISRMQIDLLVNALANDMTRVASLQYMRSVGQARMRWLKIDEGHHSLSHEPDNNQDAQEKLMRINDWFSRELLYLVQRLAATPETDGRGGSLLDHTQVVWVNELGKGNSHTLSNIPFVLMGGGAGFKTGRAIDLQGAPHNRLWMSLAHGLGHDSLESFGLERYAEEGPLRLT
ncbi:MAG: DUF1552 domain-containing protein [Verrucomicrobiota bacterium]|nr:DUF1552 domain-containing protein [Verrucomicrobiota bacterium]